MADEFRQTEIKEILRKKLNAEKIKLWLPPYTTDEGIKGETPVELISRLCGELGCPPDVVAAALENLRSHAVEKLAQKKRFDNSGIASLKVRLAGNVPSEVSLSSGEMIVEIALTVRGHDLKQAIGERSGIEPLTLKLIAGGHVIEDDKELQSFGVKNLSQVMAICLSATEAECRRKEEEARRVSRTREAAELLARYDNEGEDDSNYYLQIADQSGRKLDLPNEERKALVFAMTLHEKGRSALKKKEYGHALLLLLEADKEFKKCRSDILKAVDNYALVCLDIVWCYLLLKNVEDLPDAVVRLKACDECFCASYGANLERLAVVKGGSGTERALFMRLHLLQGIIAFHQRQWDECRTLLDRAEYELRHLQVNEDQMTQMMELGFTQQEARLGLRACDGSVQQAVAHIVKKREEKAELQKKEKEAKRKKKIARKLGKAANGQDVNIDFYENLLSMGFRKGASAAALRQSNNDLSQALQVLQDHPELLELPDPDPPEVNVTDVMLSQVTAMGFDTEGARAALYKFSGSVERAIEELLAIGGAIPESWRAAIPSTSHTSNSENAGANSSGSSSGTSPEEKALRKEAWESIVPDIPQGEDDHLDLTLDEEAAFVQEYKAMLMSLDTSQT